MVEIGGGLVGDEDGGAVDDGAGDRQALLLAAGQLDRVQFFLARQADLVQRRAARAAESQA